MVSIFISILTPIHVIVSLLIILIVLMQRPKSEGLGAAFGGGMIESFAGVQTTNVLQSATRYLGGALFVITIVLAMLYSRQSQATKGSLTSKLLSEPKPQATASPVPGATVSPSATTPAASPAAAAPSPEAAESPAAPAATAAPTAPAPAASPQATGTAK